MEILLMGNPNVGKSVVFSRLTGTSVTSSNYAGTTVEYKEGFMKWRGQQVRIIDVPGTYTLDPTNKAEEVACEMLERGDLVLNIVDATNLERNLNLTLQLLERNIPVIVLLNMWDEAGHKGIEIDVDQLRERLGVPVIPTVATRGEGLQKVLDLLDYREITDREPETTEERWAEIGHIIEGVQDLHHRHHTLTEIIEEYSIKPLTGIPLAGLVLYVSFWIIRFIGEGLIAYVADPIFTNIYLPFLQMLSSILKPGTFFHNLLIGELINGNIDFEQSFGVLSTGVFIPFSAVLPYIIAFYLILGLLEDTGYLPRLAVLVDNIMHKVGLHGFSIIPMILGFGCNVPAALAVRTLDSRREKFIASTLMAISIPCMAQTAMIIGLLGRHGGRYVIYVFAILLLVWITVGLLLDRVMSGFSSDLLLEIPPLRVPAPGVVLKKLRMRVAAFLEEALPFVLLGVLIVNLLYMLGLFQLLVAVFGPIFNHVFGLPQEAISALLIGFLRKDLAMGMLVPLDLTVKQLIIASTILTIYFPCIATFIVLIRELGVIDMLKSTVIMLITTLVVGGSLNLFLGQQHLGVYILGLVVAGMILLRFFLKSFRINRDLE